MFDVFLQTKFQASCFIALVTFSREFCRSGDMLLLLLLKTRFMLLVVTMELQDLIPLIVWTCQKMILDGCQSHQCTTGVDLQVPAPIKVSFKETLTS